MNIEQRLTFKDIPGAPHIAFDVLGTDYVSHGDGIGQIVRAGARPPSIDEHAALRIEAQARDEGMQHRDLVNKAFCTGTIVAYTRIGDDLLAIAFEFPDKSQAAYAKLAMAGQAMHNAGNELIITARSNLGRAIHAAYDKTGRSYTIPDTNSIEYETGKTGPSAFSKSKEAQALLPTQAEPYANFLNNKGYQTGVIWTLDQEDLEPKGVAKDKILIRPARLGVDFDDFIDDLGAGSQFDVGLPVAVRRAQKKVP